VVIVDDVCVIDGGCVTVVRGDVSVMRGVLGCSTRVCMAVSVVWGVTWVLALFQVVAVV
jgi:hypothetical protein